MMSIVFQIALFATVATLIAAEIKIGPFYITLQKVHMCPKMFSNIFFYFFFYLDWIAGPE